VVLFLVQIDARIPPGADRAHIARLQAEERARGLELQRQGKWKHLWRIAGRYASVSVFDVDSIDELHDLLWTLPLFAYLDIKVTPLARHPSALSAAQDEPHGAEQHVASG
jgi:muconolactone D-isomerase